MARPTVDIGRVGVWYGGIDALPTPKAIEAAQQIEELGYGALWVAEAVGRDPFVSSAVLLSGTKSLPLATGIANISDLPRVDDARRDDCAATLA